MKKKTNTLLIGLGLIMASILFSGNYSVESASAYTASITTNNSIELDITPNGDGTSIHSESINVQSDCRAGYNLTIATPEGSSLYANGDNTNTASFTAVDGTSALSSSNNTNKWGYTLTSNPTSSTVFSPLSNTESVLKTPSQTASPSADINDTFSINYGAKVDNTITPGTYQMANNGAIVYYLTMDTTCTQFTVNFNPNGGTGTIENQGIETGVSTKLTSSDSLTAPTGGSYTDADNNTITGDSDKLWTFWGWNTAVDGTGDWYKDREAVTDLASVGSTITLYAQWKQPTLADMVAGTQVGTEKVIDHNLMQDMSPETCYNSNAFSTDTSSPANQPYDSSTNPNGYHTITLLDYRGKVTTGESPESPEQYTVSKLADGLCWMTTNLNLGRSTGGDNNDGTITLTSDDTDLADNTTFTLPAGDTTSYTTTTNLAKIRLTNNNNSSDNGAYYTWAAAVANTTSTSSNPTTSICPKNWDLPTGNHFTNLNTKSSYSSNNQTTAAPSSFLVDGGFTDGVNFYQTSYSYYWSNYSYDTSRAYGVRINSSSISSSSSTGTTYGGEKYYRKNLRCVASQGTITINYDGNGTTEYPVTGSVATQTNIEINTTYTQSNGFARTGWHFNSWNTAPDGTGTTIATGASLATLNLEPGETITLYAQWLPQYTITYINNCKTYTDANSACTDSISNGTSSQKINLANDPSTGTETSTLAAYDQWTLTGWKIKGWSTVADNSDNTNTEYKVKTTYTAPSGSTVGSGITLYAHWVPVYSIQYDGNGADNPNGMGTADATTGIKSVIQTNIGEGDPVLLLANNFKKANNGFAGWSTDPDAWTHFADNNNTNDPVIYGTMETIDAPAYPTNGTNIATMYAVWVPAKKDGSNNPIYLQDWNGCPSLTSTTFNRTTGKIKATKDSIIALTDKRDNEVYTIAKLADGRCWMVENLRLEHEGTVGNNINDSSVTNENLSQGYGKYSGSGTNYGNFTGLAEAESANFTDTATVANTLYSTTADGNKNVINTANSPAYRFPRYNNSNTKNLIDNPSYTQDYTRTSSPTNTPSSDYYQTQNVYSYGNYYTWAAAMANTNYYISPTTSEEAGTSICPSGWHLPSSNGADKEFATLSKGYGGNGGNQNSSSNGGIMNNRFRSFPNNFVYSGYWSVSAAYKRGQNNAHYWSRSTRDNSRSYNLYLSATQLYPSNDYDAKNTGFSVRCLVDYTYTIKYDGNNATGGNMISNGAELKHTSLVGGETIDLYPSNYYKTGYGFAGWSTDPDAWVHFTDNDNTNNPVIYGPMETITAPTRTGSIVTLYAVWVPAEEDGNNDPVYLQDFDIASCSNLTSTTFDSNTSTITVNKNSIVALTDKRDANVYTIARLSDGNCWMTENLRLEAASTVGNNQFDSSVTNESLAQGYGGIFTGLDSAENSHFNYNTSATPNNLYNNTNITGTNPGYRFPRYNNNNTNTTLTASYNSTGKYSWYSYGNYYNWPAAMANTNYMADPSISETANTSICPAGWTLPTGGNTPKDFGNLSQQYGGSGGNQNGTADAGDVMSNRFRSFPNNFLYSGYFHESSATARGSYGYYWSRSVSDASDKSHAFDLSSTYIRPYSRNDKIYGFSVRCLVDNSYTIEYDGNGASDGSMTSNGKELKHSSLLDGKTIRLYPPNYSKTGYGFAGWSLDIDAATKLANGTQVTVYGPSDEVSIDNAFLANADTNNKITLYAVWLPADTNYTLQTFGPTQCSAMNIGDVTALSDTRDNNTYTVAKLEDGNCWTVENLRLDPSTTTFTSSNTNSPTQDFIDAAPLSSTNNTLCNDDTAACVNTVRFNTNNINRSKTASHDSNTIDKSWYSYGVMYNWYTASAGNGDFAMGTGNVVGDICPAGWRLPTGGSNSEYTEINRLANNNSTTSAAGLLKFPDNFILSGDYNYDTPAGRDYYSRFWSATPDSSSTTSNGTLKSFRFGINYNANNKISSKGSWNKWDAFAVRCIVK